MVVIRASPAPHLGEGGMERKGEGPFRASAEAPATLLQVPKLTLGPHLRPLFHRQGLA